MIDNTEKQIVKINVSSSKAKEWSRKAEQLGISRSEYLCGVLDHKLDNNTKKDKRFCLKNFFKNFLTNNK